ncbi:MAG: UDP-N-acetylmuramate--L-alanine ligase [Cyanobacteria bacterium K_Offshore_0m_m2_072]|nr:UDP-N-acetylmuramate--L-alanine ligase [Cyanobacteria bacterium K_Offshore_0m_m2_072]
MAAGHRLAAADATRKGQGAGSALISGAGLERFPLLRPRWRLPLALTLDRRQPLHFIGVGGIGMSALAGILAQRGFNVSGSDPKDQAVLTQLRQQGVRIFRQQTASTIAAIRSGISTSPMVVISSAVPESNPELAAARQAGLRICHRADILAALINAQPSIAVAGSHGKTTTSTLIATLLAATHNDPTAVIGGIVPAFGSNGRHGDGRLLVAEADESDGSLVKFKAALGVLTNLELDHTDHYPNLDALIATMQRFSRQCQQLLINHDCAVLREHFQAQHRWSIRQSDGVCFAALPRESRGDGTSADFYEHGQLVGRLAVPLAGAHNLSNVTAAVAACRLEGVSFAELQQAVAQLKAPGRRFDYRGTWQQRLVVDDYAHHPSEVAATLAMARLMVSSGRSPLPLPPQRLLAVFQPHRYSRTAEFLEGFATALSVADAVLVAPLYSAGEAPIPGISSEALAAAIHAHNPALPVQVAASNDELTALVARESRPGDLVLAMGAGDINGLWERLGRWQASDDALPLLAA